MCATSLNELPVELLLCISCYLDLETFYKVKQTSKRLYLGLKCWRGVHADNKAKDFRKALIYNRLDIVSFLLDCPTFNCMELFQSTSQCIENPIATAVKMGSVKMVMLLVSHPLIATRLVPHARTVLLREAVEREMTEIARLLIELPHLKRYPINLDLHCRRSVFMDTASTSLFKLLLDSGIADPTFDRNRLLYEQCASGNTENVRNMLKDARINPCQRNNIAIAALNSHVGTCWVLMQDPRLDPGLDDNLALSNACHAASVEIVQMLLAHPRVTVSKRLARRVQKLLKQSFDGRTSSETSPIAINAHFGSW